MSSLTPFQEACVSRGWEKPSVFLRVFQETADVLGEAVTLTDRTLLRWRQPAPSVPRARAWRVLHGMFGVCPTELGFPAAPPGANVVSDAFLQQRGADVDRRTFFTDTVGVTAAAILPAHARPLTPPGKGGAIGTVHVLELRQVLRSLFHLDDAYGGGDVRNLTERHLCRIRRIINKHTYPETIGRQLELLAGETAEHCGWVHYDADDQGSARRFWGEALTTATMLKDSSLELLVFASMSLQAMYEGRPRDGLNLASAAQERATKLGSPVLQSIIASRAAHAHTLLGDTSAGKKCMAEAMKLLDRRERGRPAPDWTAFHGRAELEYAQGLLYTEMGHHGRGVQFIRAALDHQEAAYGRNRALYGLTFAQTLIKAGEVDEGAAHAVESMGHLEEVESGRVMRKLGQVTSLLDTVDATCARDAAAELTEYARMKGAA